MKKVCYLFSFVLIFLSCATNYGEENEDYRHFFDYKNAIRLKGDAEIPKIEYMAFVLDGSGVDKISMKLKGKKPKNFCVECKRYLFGLDDHSVRFYDIYAEYDSPDFSLFISQEDIKFIYGHLDGVNDVYKKGDGSVLLFRINESAFLYPIDVKKKKKERERLNKIAKKNNYFH